MRRRSRAVYRRRGPRQGLGDAIIGDFHYNGHQLLIEVSAAAQALAKYRINPGNCSIGRKDDDNFRTMVDGCRRAPEAGAHRVNWGSLETRRC